MVEVWSRSGQLGANEFPSSFLGGFYLFGHGVPRGPRSTPKRIWLSMGEVLGHGLRLHITWARCFREIGVHQPLALRNRSCQGTKSGLLWGGGLEEAACGSQNAW